MMRSRLLLPMACKKGSNRYLLIHPSLSSPFLFPVSSRLSAEETDVNELSWTLPTEGLVLSKAYTISYKIRVGKGVDPGTVVDIPVMVKGPGIDVDEVLEVLVK